MIAIVDLGLGNAASVENMLRFVGAPVVRTSDPEVIAAAVKLVLPGVGSFDAGMTRLHESGLIPLLSRRVFEERVPVLGICLGMQLMTRSSEEGKLPGLGWVAGRTQRFRFPADSDLRIPHMGWSDVDFRGESALGQSLVSPRFYFVHSYHVVLEDELADGMCTAVYRDRFTCGFSAKKTVFGVQFHPEKSHSFGMQLFRNFAAL